MLAGMLLAGMLLAGNCAFALNPTLEVSQYAHTAWKIRDGFAKGPILSIAQTSDGYLWLGTAFGLYHFDAVRNVLWEHRQISISLPMSSRDWLQRAMGPFGSARGVGSQAGRTAHSLSMRSSGNQPSLL
jgi:ligand-binding sensor domain-containing protein